MGLEALEVENWQEKVSNPSLIGTCRGKAATVVCTAKCVWKDLELLEGENFDTLCVNDMGIYYPEEIEHWYSSHADALAGYSGLRCARVAKGQGRRSICAAPVTHSLAVSKSSADADCVWPWPGHGTSGLNAIYTALALGYDPVYVAGLPMDNTGHFNDGPPDHWLEQRTEKRKWSVYGDRKHFNPWLRAMKEVFDDKVTFLSGRFA